MEIILATHNLDKVRELKELIDTDQIDLKPISEFNIDMDVEENGESYRENALIKARYAHQKLPGKRIIADDSGLSIDILDGYPGIYSARFAGVDTAYKDKIQEIWHLLEPFDQNRWHAAFHCALAYIDEFGAEMVFEAKCQGVIIPEMRGANGFGYDPIFYMPEYKMTTAEMDPKLKNEISHRGQAARLWKKYLLDLK
ncbi:MAG: RdgB/HAM1 family non-canonical purine NTP pyrophosphatase [Clostridiaceae bacterium]|nr:RdgB/HAM1 family non-canonical purine NTP pyrophosphatase [Clostridiaceae bacterium]